MRAQRPVVHQHYLGMTALPQTRLLRLRFTHPAACREGQNQRMRRGLQKPRIRRQSRTEESDGRQDEPLSRGLRALAARPARGSGARPRHDDRLVSSGRRRCSIRTPAFTAAGSPAACATPAGTRSIATSTAAAREQPALIYDSPVTNTKQAHHLRRSCKTETAAARRHPEGPRRRQGRPRHPLHADGAGGGGRDARLRAHRRGSLGGVRRLRGQASSPPASTTPSRRSSSPRAAASRPTRVVAYKPLLDEAIELATHKPERLPDPAAAAVRGDACRRPRPRLEGDCGIARRVGQAVLECVPVEATDPLYILYTSGTTGKPKGVVRDNGGHMVALKWSMQNFYGVEPGEVYWAASDVGWVVGHSYIVYAPLLHGCTTILYEGKPVGTPDAGAFWRVIAEHGCVALFTAPTAFRAIKKEDPQGELIREVRPVEVPHAVPRRRARRPRHRQMGGEPAEGAGDRSLVADRDRLVHRRQSGGARPAAGQARLGRPCRCRAMTIDVSTTRAGRVPRDDDRLDRHQAAAAARRACRRCGSRTTRFRESYLDGVPRLLQDRRRRLHGRRRLRLRHVPHRRHHQRRRASALDRRHGGGAGVAPRRRRVRGDRHQRRAEGRGAVRLHRAQGRRRTGRTPRSRKRSSNSCASRSARSPPSSSRSPSNACPKTRSGKILRGTMKKIADGEPWTMPATIDDPAILDEIQSALKGKGVG